MRGLSSESTTDPFNPYIALADTSLNLVMVLVLFAVTVLLAIQLRENTYKDARQAFQKAVEATMAPSEKPDLIPYTTKNDPPGSQRWSFNKVLMFKTNTAQLTPQGKAVLTKFAKVLSMYGNTYRRIRIEGHTFPTPEGKRDNWSLATDRAATVANFLTGQKCAISPYFIATSGRGGQAAMDGLDPKSRKHERIEIVLEYSAQAVQPRKC